MKPFAYYMQTCEGVKLKLARDMTTDLLNLQWAGKLAWKPLYKDPK